MMGQARSLKEEEQSNPHPPLPPLSSIENDKNVEEIVEW